MLPVVQYCERAGTQVHLPPLDLAALSRKVKVPGHIINAVHK